MSQRISDITKKEIGPSPKIEVHEPDSSTSTISLKPAGFSPALTYNIFFTTFWLGFISFWTIGAAFGSIFFAAFSIPFWLVGFTMLYGILNTIFGKQEIQVKRNEIVIRKFSPLRKKELTVPYNDLISIELDTISQKAKNIKTAMRMTSSGAPDNGLFSKTPFMIYGDSSEMVFGEHLSDRDKKWLVDYLNDRIVPLMKFVR